MQMLNLAREAKKASPSLASLSSKVKDELLQRMAAALEEEAGALMAANEQDLEAARDKGLSPAMIDRLVLDEPRIGAMAAGLREVAALPDPVGEITGMWRRPNGIQVGRMRIPLGVIGIIFESRPNVTADAAGLCLKSGNAVILRGGSEAIHSNLALGAVLKRTLEGMGLPAAALQVVPTTDREAVTGTAEAGGGNRSDHPPRRGRADPFCQRKFPHPGHQALQGGLPCLRRCRRRLRYGGKNLPQCQGPASRGMQRHGDLADPQGHRRDFRALVSPGPCRDKGWSCADVR